MGWGLGFAGGFTQRASENMATERQEMWAEEQNMINTMLPIAMQERKQRRLERKGMKDTFNQLKQYMTNDSAFSVIEQGTEFSKSFLEDIQKEQDRLGRVFKDENDLRTAGLLEFKSTADLAGVRSTYKESGRTFDDFMDQYVGKPTANPSINQNEVAEDLIRHYGKIPGFENTVKNSAYRKMAASMGISPEDVSSYVSGEYSFDKDDRVAAEKPITRRRVDRSIYRKLQREEQDHADFMAIAEMGGAPELHRLNLEQLRAKIQVDLDIVGTPNQLQITANNNLFPKSVPLAGKRLSNAIGGRQIETRNETTGEVNTVSLAAEERIVDEKSVSGRFKSVYVAGGQKHRYLTSIYNSSLILSTKYMNDHNTDNANRKTVSNFTTLNASHTNSPEGVAWLLIKSAIMLDAKEGPLIKKHINVLQEVMGTDDLNRMVKQYDPATLSLNPDINNSISSIRENTIVAAPADTSNSEGEIVPANSDKGRTAAAAAEAEATAEATAEAAAAEAVKIKLEAEQQALSGVQENNLTDQTVVDMVQNPYMLKKAITAAYPTVDESIINEVIGDINIGQYSELEDSELNAMLSTIRDSISSKMPKIIPVDIDAFTELVDSVQNLYKALWWDREGLAVKKVNNAEANTIVANEKQLSSDIEYPNNIESRDQMLKYGDDMITFIENSNIKVPNEWEEVKAKYLSGTPVLSSKESFN